MFRVLIVVSRTFGSGYSSAAVGMTAQVVEYSVREQATEAVQRLCGENSTGHCFTAVMLD